MSTTTATRPAPVLPPVLPTLAAKLHAAGVDHWTEPGAVVIPAGVDTITITPTGNRAAPYRIVRARGCSRVGWTRPADLTTAVAYAAEHGIPAYSTTPPPVAVAAAAQVAHPCPEHAAAVRDAEAASRARYLAAAPTRQGRAHRGERTRLTARGAYYATAVAAAAMLATPHLLAGLANLTGR